MVMHIVMNGILIGFLEKSAAHQLILTYDKDWLNRPGARPISLSLPLQAMPHKGEKVYHFLDNLLPDNINIRAQIQARFQAATDQPFDLLAKIGRDCVGAIQFIEGELPEIKMAMQYHALTEEEIAQTLRHMKNHPLGMSTVDDFRISLAGAQEKTAFLYWNNQWNRPIGLTPTTHIFKLPMGERHPNSIENEWLCSKILKAFGLAVAECDIWRFEEIKTLVVKRFDRKISDQEILRLPQEDFCQILGISPNLKYQMDGGPGILDIMQLLLGSSNAIQDRTHFIQTQIIFWLLGAIDGHAKNFSVFLEDGGTYCLTPLYDVLSAYPFIKNHSMQIEKIKMAMALEGKNKHYRWNEITRRYFLSTAEKTNYPVKMVEILLEDILGKIEEVIKEMESILPTSFPEVIAENIFMGMKNARDLLIQY